MVRVRKQERERIAGEERDKDRMEQRQIEVGRHLISPSLLSISHSSLSSRLFPPHLLISYSLPSLPPPPQIEEMQKSQAEKADKAEEKEREVKNQAKDLVKNQRRLARWVLQNMHNSSHIKILPT